MYKEKKKKNIFKRIVAFLGATFTAIACFFAFNLNADDDKIDVYADEVVSNGYEFYGSGLSSLFTYATYVSNDDIYYHDRSLFLGKISFDFISSNGFNVDSITINYDFNSRVDTYHVTFNNISALGYLGVFLYTYAGDDIYLPIGYQFEPVDGNYDNPTFKKPIGFNYYSRNISGYISVFVEYFDSDNNLLIFDWEYIPNDVFLMNNTNLIMEKRTYYFSDVLDLSDNDYYNQGYRDGESYGYNLGYESGHSEGYRQAYGLGKNEGYNIGKNEVLNNSDIFSFNNLLTSVIDVPVKAFTSLFNFEILGVNLSGFFTGLLTIGVVIAIVRLLMGR